MSEFEVRKRRLSPHSSSEESGSERSESSDGDIARRARIRAVKVLNECVCVSVLCIVNVLSSLHHAFNPPFFFFLVEREKIHRLASQEHNVDDARACTAPNGAEKVLNQSISF